MSAVVDEIAALFHEKGNQTYLGEHVSIAEHMLQTAQAADRAKASPALIAAALLHDFGHLVHAMADDSADRGIDTVHEEAGAEWLSSAFGPEVTEPIRLHVAAKRYLCAKYPTYLDVLSPASVHSLMLQGGPFSADEATAFAALPHAAEAVQVRQWDDKGKVAGEATPSFDDYRPLLESCLRPADRLLLAASASFDAVDPASADAIWALQQYFAELDRRFPTGFDPGNALRGDAPSYRSPNGVFVVVHSDGEPIACGGVQRIDETTCEIKRMWVRAEWRGVGLGRRLLEHLEQHCRDLGGARVVLDTNSVLTEAISMYERAGFRSTERYNDNPYALRWFEKHLT